MNRNLVGIIRRGIRAVLLAALLGTGVAAAAAAQATGKVEGTIRDEAGAPIPSAEVIIVNTSFHTVANNQGYYFFNNVPSGTVAIRAAFVGYKAAEVRDVRVLAGQTLTQNIQLHSTPVALPDVEVSVAVTPLVPRDAVTTKQTVLGPYLNGLPLDRAAQALLEVPGVVGNPTGTAISIRGGRTDEAAVYIDGVPATPGYRGNAFASSRGTSVSVSTAAVSELSVTTGATSSEFGNAQSGVIQYQTRSGGSSLQGRLGYESDEPFGTSHSVGFNRLQASLGGPLYRRLTFFVSGVLEGRASIVPGADALQTPVFVPAGVDTTVAVPSALGDPLADTTFVGVQKFALYRGDCSAFAGSANSGIASNYGVSCQGIRTPYSASTIYELSSKLNYSYGDGSRVALSYLSSRNQGRTPNAFRMLDPQDLGGFRAWSDYFTLNWSQNLARSSERALALEASLGLQTDHTIAGPLTRSSELGSRNPTGGFLLGNLGFQWDFGNFPVNQELVDNYRQNIPGSRRSPLDLENRDQYGQLGPYRNSPYGIDQSLINGQIFATGGYASTTRLVLYREQRMIGKAGLDWQLDRYNRIKLGGEYTHYSIANYSHALTSQAFSDVFIESPVRYDLYAEDRLDLGDVVVVGGLRYDRYHSNAARPYVLDTVSTHPTFGQYSYFPRPNSYGAGGAELNGQPLVKYVRDPAHEYVSPHVQVSFPVSDRTNFRLSYAHQVQAPDFGLVLGGINTDISVTNTNHVYGADLDFGKTITFEFGVRHAFSDDMVLDISAYNKDNLSNAAGRLISLPDPQRLGANVDLRIMTTADFGNTRGVDVRLDRRIGRLFNGVIAYTFQQARNTGSNPFTYINFGSRIVSQLSGGNQPPPQAIFPTANSRPHNLTGSFALNFPSDWKEGTALGAILGRAGVTAVFRYSSGTAYTRCPAETGNEGVLSGQVCSRQFAGDFFGARTPSFKQLDMRFTKGFDLRGLGITAYLDARNILNFRNILTVFTTTNDIVNAAEQAQTFSGDSASFADEARASGTYNSSDGSIDLSFGGAVTSGCGAWVNAQNRPSAPDCVYLIRAEERYGNGDHRFTVAEQARASHALYLAAGRGVSAFTAAPRLMRLGVEVDF